MFIVFISPGFTTVVHYIITNNSSNVIAEKLYTADVLHVEWVGLYQYHTRCFTPINSPGYVF